MLLISLTSYGQEFQESKNYMVNDFEKYLTDEFYAKPDSLKSPIVIKVRDVNSKEVKYEQTLPYYDPDVFAFKLEERELSGYKNVSSLVRITTEEFGCCSGYTVKYYFVKNNGDWISIPEINYCIWDRPGNIPDYTFESNQNPVIQSVTLYMEHFNRKGDLVQKELLSSFDWNGKFLVEKGE